MEVSTASEAVVKPSRAVAVIAVVVLALLLPFLAQDLARVPRATPIDYVEGWNAFHTARVMRGEPLYRPVDGLPLAPVNYPPLSFLMVGLRKWTVWSYTAAAESTWSTSCSAQTGYA